MKMIMAKVPEDKKGEYERFYQYKKYIWASWIQTYFYCPYQLYLYRVKGIELPPTKEMEMGANAHAVKEIIHYMNVEEEVSIEDALFLSKMENKGFVFREFAFKTKFEKYQLSCKIDELAIYPDRVEIIDDKPGDRVYKGEIMQVLGYALAFREKFKPDREIRTIVRGRDTGEILYVKTFASEDEEEIKRTLYDIYLLLKDVVIPSIEPSLNKCERCRYREFCEYYLHLKENANKGL